MKLFDGKKVANKILKELAADIKKAKIKPSLAVILVGDDEASRLYIKLKKQAAEKVGIGFAEYVFSDKAKEADVLSKIKELNQNQKISGIIVQLPLPAVFNTDKIIEAIDPKKDVDGFCKENLRLLERGKEELLPVLPLVIQTALAGAKKLILSKNILALVNSETFGQTLKTVLSRDGFLVDYLVRNTCVLFGSEKKLKEADILISVCGCPNMIKGESIKEGAVLIDAGVTRYHDGKTVGDVDRESVKDKASFLTPVPGGIGPLTVALLLRNVYLAAETLAKK
jgi:methylenetetrahydrofolate dehydrogenase (NADP+)/methenyltetrahydrofolate cyclohydrolase